MSKQASNKEIKISVGSDDFQTLVLHNDVFVDKSLLLKDIVADDGTSFLITRPRRWGKSLNLSMIGRFVEIEVDNKGIPIPEEKKINDKLFLGGDITLTTHRAKYLKPLKIAQHQDIVDDYQGKFPVIRLNLKEINGSSIELIYEQLKNKIIRVFATYYYLITSTKVEVIDKQKLQAYLTGDFNQAELESSLAFLSSLLHAHFGKRVYILIDEYDAPINSAYLKLGYSSAEYNRVLDIMRNLFGSVLKTNEHLAKGVITGILRIAKANLLSDLNNLTENSLFDEKFSKSYGFTQEEVDELLQQVPLKVTPQEIKDWYNGYTFGGQIIYNPWSIMQCLSNAGKLEHYWLDTGGTGIIDHVLRSGEVQEDLQNLVTGKSIISEVTKYISFNTIETKVGLYSLLLLSGYLNPRVVYLEDNVYELSIPNREISYIYRERIMEWLKTNINIDKAQYYFFTRLLIQGKLEEFTARLREILSTLSFYQTGGTRAEIFYNGFMVAALSFLSDAYLIEYEAESGSGRADTILVSKFGKGTNAIIVEYKVCKAEEDLATSAASGLKQINDRNYAAKIRQHSHITQIIKISISFCGKNAETAYSIEIVG